MKKLLAVTVLLFIMLSNSAAALNVGVAPPILELGKQNRGSQVSGSFYVVSDSDMDFIVDLDSIDVPTDFFDPYRPRIKYTFDAERASQEGSSEWVVFLENSVNVPGEKYFVPGVNAWVNRKIDFILNIPADAEPGYHAVQIVPIPRVASTGSGGVGIGIVTIVKTTLIFIVEGDAERSAEVIGFDYNRIDDNYEEIYVLIKNTGTVTTGVRLDSLEIDEGTGVTKLPGTGHYNVAPNEIIRIKSKYGVGDKELGSYKADASISWMTGEAEGQGSIEVIEYSKSSITGDVVAPPLVPGAAFPFWVVPILIIFSAIVIYWWKNGKY